MYARTTSATSRTSSQRFSTFGRALPLRVRRAGEVGARAPLQSPQCPQNDETEDHHSEHDLDHSSARLAALGDELPWCNHAARGAKPDAVRSTREQEADRLVLSDKQIAVGPGWAADDDRAVYVALDALVDLDGQQPLPCSLRLSRPLGDDASDDRGIGGIETLGERRIDAHTCKRRFRGQKRRDDRDHEDESLHAK